MGLRLFGSHDQTDARTSAAIAVMERPGLTMGGMAEPVGPVGPSIVLTHDGWRVGRPAHSERRALDALSSQTLYLITDHGTETIDRDEVIMVVPPPLTDVSPLKLAKQPIPVSVDIGVATLRGQIHVLAGVSPWETWQRSPSGFVATTQAVLEFKDGTTETAETVLVSRHTAHSGLLPAEN